MALSSSERVRVLRQRERERASSLLSLRIIERGESKREPSHHALCTPTDKQEGATQSEKKGRLSMLLVPVPVPARLLVGWLVGWLIIRTTFTFTLFTFYKNMISVSTVRIILSR